MGRLIVIKGADFSENALFKEKDFNILVSANSKAYVILNATGYNQSQTPSERNGTVVTLDNTNSNLDNWFSFNPSEYITGELLHLAGAFSTWNGYTNNKIKNIRIKANTLSSSGQYTFFAPIFSDNIITDVVIKSNICPFNLKNYSIKTFRLKTPSLNKDLFFQSDNYLDTLDISGVSVSYSSSGLKISHPSKIIMNDCTQESITNLINSQANGFSETYVQSTDTLGNTVLIKQ